MTHNSATGMKHTVSIYILIILIAGLAFPVNAQKDCRDLVFTYNPRYASNNDTLHVSWQTGCYDGTLRTLGKNKLKVRNERNVYFRFININPNNFSVDDKSTSVSFTIPNSSSDDFLSQVGKLSPADDRKNEKDSINSKELADELKSASEGFISKSKSLMSISGIQSFNNNAIETTEIEPLPVESNKIKLSETFQSVSNSLEKKYNELTEAKKKYDALLAEYANLSIEISKTKKLLSSLKTLQYSDSELTTIKDGAFGCLCRD